MALETLFGTAIPEPNSGCWLWSRAVGSHGYGVLWHDGKVKTAHRLAYTMANGPIPAGKHVLHKCDVKSCINPDHLFLGADADNRIDMARKGRGTSPLTNAQIREIREDPRRDSEVARHYRVHISTIGNIRARRNRRYV
jgi:hypothetical protein